jgi:TPP-dependent pyruvate/acetoin dehydrogenase alpha subunit
MYDPDLYRDKGEIETWKQRDPIAAFTTALEGLGLLEDGDVERITSEADADVDDAVAYAEAGTLEPVEELERFVYAEAQAEAGS